MSKLKYIFLLLLGIGCLNAGEGVSKSPRSDESDENYESDFDSDGSSDSSPRSNASSQSQNSNLGSLMPSAFQVFYDQKESSGNTNPRTSTPDTGTQTPETSEGQTTPREFTGSTSPNAGSLELEVTLRPEDAERGFSTTSSMEVGDVLLDALNDDRQILFSTDSMEKPKPTELDMNVIQSSISGNQIAGNDSDPRPFDPKLTQIGFQEAMRARPNTGEGGDPNRTLLPKQPRAVTANTYSSNSRNRSGGLLPKESIGLPPRRPGTVLEIQPNTFGNDPDVPGSRYTVNDLPGAMSIISQTREILRNPRDMLHEKVKNELDIMKKTNNNLTQFYNEIRNTSKTFNNFTDQQFASILKLGAIINDRSGQKESSVKKVVYDTLEKVRKGEEKARAEIREEKNRRAELYRQTASQQDAAMARLSAPKGMNSRPGTVSGSRPRTNNGLPPRPGTSSGMPGSLRRNAGQTGGGAVSMEGQRFLSDQRKEEAARRGAGKTTPAASKQLTEEEKSKIAKWVKDIQDGLPRINEKIQKLEKNNTELKKINDLRSTEQLEENNKKLQTIKRLRDNINKFIQKYQNPGSTGLINKIKEEFEQISNSPHFMYPDT